jgi:hypothetical protein
MTVSSAASRQLANRSRVEVVGDSYVIPADDIVRHRERKTAPWTWLRSSEEAKVSRCAGFRKYDFDRLTDSSSLQKNPL